MNLNVEQEVAALKRMTTPELRQRYAEVCGDGTASNNRVWMVKRIAWRLQAQVDGDLSERAKRRAAELANDQVLFRPDPIGHYTEDLDTEFLRYAAAKHRLCGPMHPLAQVPNWKYLNAGGGR